MDSLLIPAILYYDWPLIVGGIFLLTALLNQYVFEQAYKKTKTKRPIKRNMTALVLGIVGVLFLALYPLNNYLRTARAGSQLKAASLGNIRAAPFTLYSLGDHPVPSLDVQFRSIDKITVGPVPGTVYFEESYSPTNNVSYTGDATSYGQVSVYEYANPASGPEQACNGDVIAEMAGTAATTTPGKVTCQLLDSNGGRPIYGYSATGAPQIDVLLSNYGNTRIVMQFVSQTLTLQQQIAFFQQLRSADPEKIRYFIPS
ncbi:MAG TPA: hypothetical protein VLF91_04570 [Candidatus Saccharimonadales bacterium]|nr:hypothetical protein [Candidatus Saccharimonadales bacterium]